MISVVLPSHNGSRYIRQSIESVLHQTYTDWELIVIDDCSTDLTGKLVSEYAARDKRIRLYRNENNIKLPASLNRGFSYAKGEYLTWTSDDNIYKSEAFEKLREAFEPEVGLVFSAMDYINQDGQICGHTPSVDCMDELYYKNIVMASFMYTREAYLKTGKYNTNKFLVEDHDYWLRIARNFKIKYLADSLYYYRTHPGSLTETRNCQMLDAKIKLMAELLYYYDSRLTDRIKANIYREIAIAAFGLDRYPLMHESIEKMEELKDYDSLPDKIRIANAMGEKSMHMVKRLYRTFMKRK